MHLIMIFCLSEHHDLHRTHFLECSSAVDGQITVYMYPILRACNDQEVYTVRYIHNVSVYEETRKCDGMPRSKDKEQKHSKGKLKIWSLQQLER